MEGIYWKRYAFAVLSCGIALVRHWASGQGPAEVVSGLLLDLLSLSFTHEVLLCVASHLAGAAGTDVHSHQLPVPTV